MIKRYIVLEKTTGAIDGVYTDKKIASNMVDAMTEQYPNSSWVLCELLGKQSGHSKFLIHHQESQMNDVLHSIYGNAWLKIKPMINDRKRDEHLSFRRGNEIAKTLWFNEKYNAFDVLVDYAFGGDKDAALEHLKTL